jgi:hypothetical protein
VSAIREEFDPFEALNSLTLDISNLSNPSPLGISVPEVPKCAFQQRL